MSQITIRLPILVQQVKVEGKQQYYLRPLFTNSPGATDLRFERALSKLKSQLKRQFRGFEVDRESMDTLLWYKFNPDYTFKTYPLELTAGKQFIKGKFTATYFDLRGTRFVCLPAFNHIFIPEKNEKGKYDIKSEVVHAIQKYVKARKGDEEFDIKQYMATKGEFVTELECSVNINYGKFSFEADNSFSFFAGFGNSQDFEGSEEILKVGNDLNAYYPGELRRAYYRDTLVKRLSNIIYQLENTPIVIVGQEGVGKHTIIHETVWRHLQKNEAKNSEHLEKIWHIDPTRIIAGMSVVGMWQKRFEAILRYVIERRSKLKLKSKKADKILIDNVVSMLSIGKSSQNDMTLSDVLKPYLEKRMMQVILIATPEQWKILQDKDRRFADLFQVIRVYEPDEETAVKMIARQRLNLELNHSCTISTQAIAHVFSLHRNYLRAHALPGGMMRMLEQLASRHKFGNIDIPQVREAFEEQSGLQWEVFDESFTFEKNEVRDSIAAGLIGQPQAAECLAETIHLIKAKLNTPGKPLGSFLFIGPTGVGKTQAAKVLCNYLMGSEEHLMRFDMNEYIDAGAVQRLIGDINNPEGQLTGKVRYQPFGIVLLDEIEKAHRSVHDILLQVLDDGRLTDSRGRTTDFTNTIIIMTSNVGARDVDSTIGLGKATRDDAAVYRKSVENHFRPEFINRIDRIVIFNNLQLAHILNIAKLQIQELLRRDGFVRRMTILNIDAQALDWVAKRGFDERMGGRALKRQIERDLTALSADQLIRTYSERPVIFNIHFENGHLQPSILPLDFVESLQGDWLETLPSDKQVKAFYKKLLRRIDKLRNSIKRDNENSTIVVPANGMTDWHRYHYKNQIEEIRERINNRILGFGHDIIEKALKPLRIKRVGLSSIVGRLEPETKRRNLMKDRIFQRDGIDELKDAFRYGMEHFDRAQTRYLNDLIALEFLELATNAFHDNRTDRIEIKVRSCVAAAGDAEVEFLLKLYANIFEGMDIQYEYHKARRSITAEGYALYPQFFSEQGIHLFYHPHKNPLPILLIVSNLNKSVTDDPIPKVIRIYDGFDTITDLRTDFSNSADIAPEEFGVFLYGGMMT